MLAEKLFEEREKKGEVKSDVRPLLRAIFGPEYDGLDESLNDNAELVADVDDALLALGESHPMGNLQWYLVKEHYVNGTSKDELLAQLTDNIDVLYDELLSLSLRYLRNPAQSRALRQYLPKTEE